MTTEHDVIYLEPLQENYGWDGRGWSPSDYYADIRGEPGVPFLLATPLRLAADDLYAALEEIVAMNVQYCIDRYGDASKADSMGCVVTARAAISKARSIPEGGEK
jgi:hypothetical protein